MFRLRALLLVLPLLFAACPGDDREFTIESECLQLDLSGRGGYIRDYQYSRYRFFDVGKFGGVNYLSTGDSIITFYLYQSVGTLDPNEPVAVAYPNSLEPKSSPDSVQQRFRNLNLGTEYELFLDPDAGQNFIFFPERLQGVQTSTLAYHMVVKKADGSILNFGDLAGVPFRLQILKRSNPHPGDPFWAAEWKNVYYLGMRDIQYGRLTVQIYKGNIEDEGNPSHSNQENGLSYLTMFGLDLAGREGIGLPDGRIDDNPHVLFLAKGLLVFPDQYPFADSEHLEHPLGLIYTTMNPTDLREASLYYIDAFEAPSRSRRLGHINLIENSETVIWRGYRLSRGVHYNIDYEVGEIEFIDMDVWERHEPNSVEVCYQYRGFGW